MLALPPSTILMSIETLLGKLIEDEKTVWFLPTVD